MHGNLLLFDFSKIGPLERLGLLKTQKLETQKQIKLKSTKFKSRVVKKKDWETYKTDWLLRCKFSEVYRMCGV